MTLSKKNKFLRIVKRLGRDLRFFPAFLVPSNITQKLRSRQPSEHCLSSSRHDPAWSHKRQTTALEDSTILTKQPSFSLPGRRAGFPRPHLF